MRNKVVILIHGPYKGNAYRKIFLGLRKIRNKIKQIVISTYINDVLETEKDIKEFHQDFNIRIIYCKDIINPGYFNLNRQILTVKKGLEEINDNECLIIKLRNDQWCNFSKLYKLLKKQYGEVKEERILTTNCYTRKDRLYHPSDMFLCGKYKTLFLYYSLKLQDKTHLDCELEMLKKLKYSIEGFEKYLISPESELFKNYLRCKEWNLLYTKEDSYNALKQFMYIINTWDIGLRWNKQRNAFLPAKTIILPYKFCLEPFANAPREMASCYSRHDFEGNETIRDKFFIGFSNAIFNLRYDSSFKTFRSSLNKLVVLFVPSKIRKYMLRYNMGKALKEFINS